MEISLWPAGISSSAPGTVQWAGGKRYRLFTITQASDIDALQA